MNFHHRLQRLLVTGMSGSGKTTLLLRLIKSHSHRWLFIFDPEREFAHKLGLPISTHPVDMARRAGQGKPVAFDPSTMFPGDLESGFAFFCKWVLDFSRMQVNGRPVVNGPKLFVADELQNFTQTGKGGISKQFGELLNQGRRQELDTIFSSQAPNFVHQQIRLQATELFTLHHEDQSVLDWLSPDFDPVAVRSLAVPGGFLHKRRFAVAHSKGKPDRVPARRAQEPKRDRGGIEAVRVDGGVSPAKRTPEKVRSIDR